MAERPGRTDVGQTPMWGWSAARLASSIAAGEISAVEAVDAHVERIDEVNPDLNAVVWRRVEAAREEARDVDRRRRAGERLGPLAGVPITIKECLDLEGSPSTFGAVSRRDHRAAADDAYVARLRRAGAIVLGKTNVAQLLLYYESDNPLFGACRNPWDRERTPGGSSGGQAAIVAAGGSPLGLGTDIGGSSRIPAAFCGIVGFKATAGRMPDAGRASVPFGQQAIPSQVGVFARDVADAALALEVASGGAEPVAPGPAPLAPMHEVDPSKLRVGWFADDGLFAASPCARRAVREAAEAFAGLGARVSEWRVPDAALAESLFYGLLSGDRFAGMRRVLGATPRDPRTRLLEQAATAPRLLVDLMLRATRRERTRAVVRAFGPYDTDSYWRRTESLADYRQRALAALADLDVLISPASPLPALRHGASAEVGLMGVYGSLYNVLGWPAGVLPWTRVRPDEESRRPPSRDPCEVAARETERGSAGLPMCVQIAARPWNDHVALAALAALESRARTRPDFPVTPVR